MSSAFQNINPITPSAQIGPIIRNGGAITNDAFLPGNVFFKYLKVGTGGTDGNITIENVDDSGVPFTYVLANAQKTEGLIWAQGRRVMASGTVATNIYWYTG